MLDAAQELARIDDAAKAVQERLARSGRALVDPNGPPPILVVAGSGLGALAGRVQDALEVPYTELRHFPASTVVGHSGKLVFGRVGGVPAVVMSGRKHLYEGAPATTVVLPLRALVRAGVRTIVLSNAAGALNPRFDVGDLMLISDHVNWQFQNPLVGPNLDAMGPRFPDMSEPYSRELRDVARSVAAQAGLPIREGVYWGNLGPTYETAAEVHMLRLFADVVGMSTVLETIAAIHAGARVLGITVVTNHLVNKTGPVTHDEVMETGRVVGDRFCRFVEALMPRLQEA